MNHSLTLMVTGMTCNACVEHVQKALLPFAQKVIVTLQPPQAVLHEPRANLAELQKALAGTRYQLHPVRPSNSDNPVEMHTSHLIETVVSVTWIKTYYPLLLLLSFILGVSVLAQVQGEISTMLTMRYFMAGFFICFAFFKLLDISAFADAYAGYDLLANKWRTWGFIYPFVELFLGVMYLINWQPQWVNSITVVVMGFSAIGVIQAVLNRRKIRCACLGAVFNLPMSTVTIIEDGGIVIMAAIMLMH